jgi:Tfp pilus assembly protein PilF
VYAVSQRTNEASTAYKQADALNPKLLLSKQKLVELALGQDRLEEAATYIDALINTSGGKVAGLYLKGRLELAKNQVANALHISSRS